MDELTMRNGNIAIAIKIIPYDPHQLPSTLRGDRLREASQSFMNNELTRREIWENGTIVFTLNGLLHRTDGPAIIRDDGREEYWEDGVRMR